MMIHYLLLCVLGQIIRQIDVNYFLSLRNIHVKYELKKIKWKRHQGIFNYFIKTKKCSVGKVGLNENTESLKNIVF